MGGKTRLVPGTSTHARMFGVMDYSNSLKSLGYEQRLFISGNRIDVPVLSDRAILEMENLRKDIARDLGKNIDEVLIPYEQIKTTLAYAENKDWAQYLKDNGYTILDIGNPNMINESSAFYDMEKLVLFK